MYRINKLDGTELGVSESIIYIRIHPNGCFTSATEETAIGVAYNSIPYNLIGHDEIEGAETVIVSRIDGGHEISGLKEKSNIHTDHLAEVDEIAIELFEQNLKLEEVNAEQDEAIIEIYEAMEVANNG